ncbi:hypothetical protein Hamer_G023848 [Homarus americanus]|uniref:Uncharacterized protein n=1 Tax=Homarus americanus TaxID=6706 RepID=A0A8J5NAW2_HOMAM|nr:hypothetical protein Hamer_G023848 [Homarus americanus]
MSHQTTSQAQSCWKVQYREVRLYIASQVREGELDKFFEGENQVHPPVLSQFGKLKHGTTKAFRVEVVWDEWFPHSTKAGTREGKGKGVKKRVEVTGLIPRNWQEFLRLDENKSEPFSFLAVRVVSKKKEKQLPRMVVAHASDQWRSMGSEQGTDHCSVDGAFTRNCHTVVTECLGTAWQWRQDGGTGGGVAASHWKSACVWVWPRAHREACCGGLS